MLEIFRESKNTHWTRLQENINECKTMRHRIAHRYSHNYHRCINVYEIYFCDYITILLKIHCKDNNSVTARMFTFHWTIALCYTKIIVCRKSLYFDRFKNQFFLDKLADSQRVLAVYGLKACLLARLLNIQLTMINLKLA